MVLMKMGNKKKIYIRLDFCNTVIPGRFVLFVCTAVIYNSTKGTFSFLIKEFLTVERPLSNRMDGSGHSKMLQRSCSRFAHCYKKLKHDTYKGIVLV